ncbi:MAG: hypothetical protein FJY43_00780 [Betaproteobacteria bacterium]|nr:hypothetical protein [Betaproteobacteria bacterium]
MVFSDLHTFDRELAQSLTAARDPVVVTSADRITQRQMPPRLEKWLAAVDDSGGKIETQSVDQAGRSRARWASSSRSSARSGRRANSPSSNNTQRPEISTQKSYRLDASGDRVMERVEWSRRQR